MILVLGMEAFDNDSTVGVMLQILYHDFLTQFSSLW
jgi:hypothetical protein